MQVPQSIAGMSSRWSRSELRNAEGKGVATRAAESLREDQHVQFSQEAKQALNQRVEDGALHAGSAESYPEVAICPECGSANCGCLARLEAQRKLDELRAGRSTERVNEIYTGQRAS